MAIATRSSIGVFGAGYVGLVTASAFAELGRTVVLYDVDAKKLEVLRAGGLPIHEPGLSELVHRNVRADRLRFTSDPRDAVAGMCAVFIAVGTPMLTDGAADLRYVLDAARTIARELDGPTLVINKSTVPVETGDAVAATIRDERPDRRLDVAVASNPEFLREGNAVRDFFHPDRIVIGCGDAASEALLRELYAPLDAPLIVTDVRTAEMIKYTANAFLATKISFANEIAAICERVGADVKAVVAGAGADRRIGGAFLGAGLGFGGSCLPKDVNALRRIAQESDVPPLLLDAVLDVNSRQVARVQSKIEVLLGGLRGRRIGVLGLSFKPQTDDVRESPAIALIEALLEAGATVTAHDPVAIANARLRLGDRVAYAPVEDHHAAAAGADALVLATEWNEYRDLDVIRLKSLMRRPVIVDARNLYEPSAFHAAGFEYACIGRKAPHLRVAHAEQHSA